MNRREIDIFEDRLGDDWIGFVFVGPGIALSSENVRVQFVDGRWRLAYADGGVSIMEEDEYRIAALLKVVARRCGFEADLRLSDDD